MIPDNTVFIAALHHTTTDAIQFLDPLDTPDRYAGQLEWLRKVVDRASAATRAERAPMLQVSDVRKIMERSGNWSEVRPEWGLAGNAAFVIGPRWLTQDANLNGRVFLHQYAFEKDPDGKALLGIMSAPMIVTQWINLQYYASTVDQRHYGSGTKTVHNVVGQFGILSGNGGDLRTGLAWQSIHDGQSYVHPPLRLQVVIAASRQAISRILDEDTSLANLFNNQWMHLVALDHGRFYHYHATEGWQLLKIPPQPVPSNDTSDRYRTDAVRKITWSRRLTKNPRPIAPVSSLVHEGSGI